MSAGFLGRLITKALTGSPRSEFRNLLLGHFETDLQALPVLTESFDTTDHPNLHLALEALLKQGKRSSELHGVGGGSEFPGIGLSRLVSGGSTVYEGPPPTRGPVQYVNIPLDDEVLACVQRGLYLMRDGDRRFAILVRGPNETFQQKLQVEVLASTKAAAEGFLAELRRAMRERSVYRGRVISFERSAFGHLGVVFHRLPKIERRQIILPAGVLERVERETLLFARHSAKLLAAGRHLKRGVLLHGRPGTGKTLTAMYLACHMGEGTVFLVTGLDFGLLPQMCRMAGMLQPSIVILEDVDLIAEERSRPGCMSPLLLELLNHMDGLSEDSDIVFLLTTNRPEILEPALSARPGRVDQAIELPIPDAACRRRLFELYAQGLAMEVAELDRFIERTEGASPAFIRELLRKAAVFAAEDSRDGLVVHDRHLDEALRELVVRGGGLTQALLGAGIPAADGPA